VPFYLFPLTFSLSTPQERVRVRSAVEFYIFIPPSKKSKNF